MHQTTISWRWATALLVALGCDSTAPRGCDVCTTSAVIYGRVTDSDGQPVARASIEISAFRENCGGAPRPIFRAETGSNNPVLTGEDGMYRTRLRSSLSSSNDCLLLRVTPPSGVSLSSMTVEGIQVRFRDETPSGGLDSVRVDITLQVSPTLGKSAAFFRLHDLTHFAVDRRRPLICSCAPQSSRALSPVSICLCTKACWTSL